MKPNSVKLFVRHSRLSIPRSFLCTAAYSPPKENTLTPREVVEKLDQYIVGQESAKKAVAVAYRNRWRRELIPHDMQNEVIPKNILMIGSTGCGKTEVARRLAKLVDAPFIKTDATKYTEVGFVGQDVNEIVSDLVVAAMSRVRHKISEEVNVEAELATTSDIIKAIRATLKKKVGAMPSGGDEGKDEVVLNEEDCKLKEMHEETDEMLTARYHAGELDDMMIRIDVPNKAPANGPIGVISLTTDAQLKDVDDALINFLSGKLAGTSGRTANVTRKSITVASAREKILESHKESLFADREGEIKSRAIRDSERNGIVFIDEIDKVASSSDHFSGGGRDASAEGVQRDLLPIIEGTVVNTKHGHVNTEHILFIAAGSFHSCKPSDLLPELQGRLPVRVTLESLTEADLYRILTEPVNNLIRQQVELMKTEDLTLTFTEDAIREIAKIAYQVNRSVENIGARRLHTVVEKILEDISFTASESTNTAFEVTPQYAQDKVKSFTHATDLKKYII